MKIVIVPAIPQQEEMPPVAQGCRYQVKQEAGVYRCYTEEEYVSLQAQQQQSNIEAYKRAEQAIAAYWWVPIIFLVVIILIMRFVPKQY